MTIEALREHFLLCAHLTLFKSTPSLAISYSGESSRTVPPFDDPVRHVVDFSLGINGRCRTESSCGPDRRRSQSLQHIRWLQGRRGAR